MIESMQGYLALLDDADLSPRDRMVRLAETLDQLVRAYQAMPSGHPADGAEPPDADDVALRRKVCLVFPDFGYYTPAAAQPASVADAVEDVVDIAAELEQVAWRYRNLGEGDAAWYFKFSYEHHWGRHLQDLRGYVHALLLKHR